MKQAVIDIGSNSIRLTLYETENRDFKILFREKIMAGLAGYVEDGKLSAEGIECACTGLLTFRGVLQTLDIEHVSVFATASLRNISNTEQALSLIRAATGYSVQVVSGEEEALLGYAGAMRELHLTGGVFLDIGGASTEIVTFDKGEPMSFTSFPVGSLSLYRPERARSDGCGGKSRMLSGQTAACRMFLLCLSVSEVRRVRCCACRSIIISYPMSVTA